VGRSLNGLRVTAMLSLLLGVSLSMGLITGCRGRSQAQQTDQASSEEASEFQKAPPFKLLDLEGKETQLKDHAGKVILLDFWATWCPPCLDEIPHFIELYEQHQKQGFVILGVAVGESRDRVAAFYEKMDMNYPVLLGDEAILEAYPGIYFLPTAFLIDRSGFIRERLIGYQAKEPLEQKVLLLLEGTS